jgi:2-oxo-4-hydroxy-4-carboxy--5-ureidoimidazoline (OHCU) decarboxylase
MDVAALNGLDEAAFVREMEPLFEGTPGFLRRLASERPFLDETDLFQFARRVALALPAGQQVELVNAHPRIGAPAASVSAASFVEQGYDRQVVGTSAEATRGRAQAELDRLNAEYEQRFGFRFVIFVNGRSREEVAPEIERRLEFDRAHEMRSALEQVVAIAQDRWRKRA